MSSSKTCHFLLSLESQSVLRFIMTHVGTIDELYFSRCSVGKYGSPVFLFLDIGLKCHISSKRVYLQLSGIFTVTVMQITATLLVQSIKIQDILRLSFKLAKIKLLLKSISLDYHLLGLNFEGFDPLVT